MSICELSSNIMGYEDIKNFKFNISGVKFIIVGIDLYSLNNKAYCYQVQTIQFNEKGQKKDALFLNNLFPNDFFSMLESFRYIKMLKND